MNSNAKAVAWSEGFEAGWQNEARLQEALRNGRRIPAVPVNPYLDAFTPAAIDQAARDQERFDAGWNAGYDAAEAKRMPIVEAYALVAADLEREGRDTADWDVINALLEVRERLTKMEDGK